MADNGLPGITFWLKESSTVAVTGKYVVTVTLLANFKDEAQWNVAKGKLEAGLKIFTVDDVKSQIITALQDEVKSLEAQTSDLQAQVNQLLYEKTSMQLELDQLTESAYAVEALEQLLKAPI